MSIITFRNPIRNHGDSGLVSMVTETIQFQIVQDINWRWPYYETVRLEIKNCIHCMWLCPHVIRKMFLPYSLSFLKELEQSGLEGFSSNIQHSLCQLRRLVGQFQGRNSWEVSQTDNLLTDTFFDIKFISFSAVH